MTVISHALAYALFAYGYDIRPFISDSMNILMTSLCGYAILMDLFAVAMHALGLSSGAALFGAMIGLIAVTVPAVIFYTWKDARRSDAVLDCVPDESEEQAFRGFDDMRLNVSSRRSVRTHKMKFSSSGYVKYIIANFRETEVIAHCGRVVRWLPSLALNLLCSGGAARPRSCSISSTTSA
jgi:hypothetical protein